MTPSEKFVAELCKNAFLSFWSFPSPLGKKNKELCDLLVVCDPDIIIFSVKEVAIKDTGDISTDSERWHRKAVEKSVDQIYGAERILGLMDEVVLADGITKVKLPDKSKRRIHRVAVAFGAQNKLPFSYGDFGKGFVHTFDEIALPIFLNELDTISDFVEYLLALEDFFKNRRRVLNAGPEDTLALYLQSGFNIPEEADLISIDPEMWTDYRKSEEYITERELNKKSYLWDKIIETLTKSHDDNILLQSISRDNLEVSIRQMNRESRYSRRVFSNMLMEVWGDGVNKSSIKARLAKTNIPGSQTYVFLKRGDDREQSKKELGLRCFVARYLCSDCNSVIGIACNPIVKGEGYSFDVVYINIDNWTDEMSVNAEEMINEFGYFKNFPKSGIPFKDM